jgi:hypothetical protein
MFDSLRNRKLRSSCVDTSIDTRRERLVAIAGDAFEQSTESDSRAVGDPV